MKVKQEAHLGLNYPQILHLTGEATISRQMKLNI